MVVLRDAACASFGAHLDSQMRPTLSHKKSLFAQGLLVPFLCNTVNPIPKKELAEVLKTNAP